MTVEIDKDALNDDATPFRIDAVPELFDSTRDQLKKAYTQYCEAERLLTYVSNTLGRVLGARCASNQPAALCWQTLARCSA